MKNSNLELLTPENSILMLVDYQPAMFKGVGSGDRNTIKNSAVAVATAASILNVPVVLTSINPGQNGEFIKDITGLFPGKEVIARKIPEFDSLEDEKVFKAVKSTGRKKIVIAGLWTSMCFAFSAIHALREEMDVYGLVDAAGDSTPDAHKYGIKRMIHSGMIPITWETVTSEWMHDWANPKAPELIEKVYHRYDAILGM